MSSNRGRCLAGMIIACGLAALGCHATTQRLQIVEQSALSNADEFAARRGIDLLPDERVLLSYEISSESFELYVPAGLHHGEATAGLVWVGAGRSGAPPRSWTSVLDRLGVVWTGANQAGNRRSPPERINLALDAAQHLRSLLDPVEPRVFVAGFSGGARIASEAALLYPDVFSGGLFAGAADYFRYVRSSDPRFSAWEPTFPPPASGLLQLARTRGRYVLLTGSDDENRALVRDVSQAFVEDGFASTTLLDVSELGHELPPVTCFERALLDLLYESGAAPAKADHLEHTILNCDLSQ